MPRQKLPLPVIWQNEPGHLSRLILEELTLYAKDKQFYPPQRALFRNMAYPIYNAVTMTLEPARYPHLEENLFNYWFKRLVQEGFIEIDQQSRAIRCIKLAIVEKPDIEP